MIDINVWASEKISKQIKSLLLRTLVFTNEANMQYLHENNINGYIPDNQFRRRDPKFIDQKSKYGKRKTYTKKTKTISVIPASEFSFDPTEKSCTCPTGERMWLKKKALTSAATIKYFLKVD